LELSTVSSSPKKSQRITRWLFSTSSQNPSSEMIHSILPTIQCSKRSCKSFAPRSLSTLALFPPLALFLNSLSRQPHLLTQVRLATQSQFSCRQSRHENFLPSQTKTTANAVVLVYIKKKARAKLSLFSSSSLFRLRHFQWRNLQPEIMWRFHRHIIFLFFQ
jgi:hypothetical protein